MDFTAQIGAAFLFLRGDWECSGIPRTIRAATPSSHCQIQSLLSWNQRWHRGTCGLLRRKSEHVSRSQLTPGYFLQRRENRATWKAESQKQRNNELPFRIQRSNHLLERAQSRQHKMDCLTLSKQMIWLQGLQKHTKVTRQESFSRPELLAKKSLWSWQL